VNEPEPSILDYLKSKFVPWMYPSLEHPLLPSIEEPAASDQPTTRSAAWPWRVLLGLLLALIAQRLLEPVAGSGPYRPWLSGVALYAASALLIAWAVWRKEMRIALPPAVKPVIDDRLKARVIPFAAGLGLALLAFVTATNNRFTLLNGSLLLASIACMVYAFWLPGTPQNISIAEIIDQLKDRKIRSQLLVLPLAIGLVLLIAAFFRFSRLAEVPGEMNSDHAEKIFDVLRVLSGQTSIFFPNNGGREALNMYLVAALNRFFGIPVDFMALKTISTLAGYLTLPFVFLLGREIANNRTGLLAMAFFGVAYWPNTVSRLGLRLPFYFLFTALVLYFLVRGLRRGNRNDFIWLGLALGFGMYGYSADRILPVVVLLGLGIFLLHKISPPNSAFNKKTATIYIGMALLLALVVFLPMLRYLLEQPEVFLNRTLTRLIGLEHPLQAPAALIFLRNTGHALAMFSWSDGEVWTVSVPNRPALDTVTGALFWTGIVAIAVTYLRKRRWEHLFLLASIPFLMLPSILALAFPNENPNLYRTAGAAIPVFLLVGLCLDGIMRSIRQWLVKSGRIFAWLVAATLFLVSAYQSYNLVFDQYRLEYALNSWNTSEMGQVVKNFVGTFGSVDNVWVMGYPYWVDTRLVGIIAGYPTHEFAMFSENVNQIPNNGAAKLFMINPQDQQAITTLQQHFPQGALTNYPAKVPGKDFLLYFVPSQIGP
jgi:Ca2+/Na+ antiporter